MGAASLFAAFERGLTPTESESDAALQRAMSCTVALTKHFYGSGDASDHMTLIGSTVKYTTIKPANDIDVVFHMPPGTYSQYNDYAGNGQSALLQSVRSVLSTRYPATTIKGDGPVVVVEFVSGAAVEIVPAVLCTDATILAVDCSVPVTRDGGRWEATDYGAQFDQFHGVDGVRKHQLARLMRYMKAWRRANHAVIKSIVIELMAIDFFSTWDTGREQISHTYDDWLVRDFLAYMVKNQDKAYTLAGNGKRITAGYGWRQDASAAFADAQRACEVSEDSASYITYWRKVLGNGFGS